VSPKTSTFYFLNNSYQKLTDFNDFWHIKSGENLTRKSYRLSTSPVSDVATVPWEIQESHFQQYCSDYLRYLTRKQTVIHLPTSPENVTTLTCEMQNFFYLSEGLLRSFRCWRLWKEPVVRCRRWLWKELVVMCGNWNVSQAVSQRVFRVTTFCINTCFQSFSTLFSRIVHHAVLQFSPCHNKPLPQASTRPYQYTRSSYCVPQTQY